MTWMKRLLRRRAVRIVLDVGLFVGFIIEFVTREPSFDPDYFLHSWTGIVLIPVIALHLSSNWAWVMRLIRNGSDDREFSLGVVNSVLAAMAAFCIVSGFPLWLDWSAAGWLVTSHQVTGLLSILLMFVHLVMNRRRIGTLVRGRSAAPAA